MVLVALARTMRIATVILCVACFSTPMIAKGETDLFHGLVRDGLGAAVPNVEILFLHEAPGAPPVARTSSGADGRFVVRGLVPGLYRVAGVKEGYRLYLGRVNTFVRSNLSMILQPIGEGASADPAALPTDPAWVLRVPRRGLLQETEAVVPARHASAADTPADRAEAVQELLRGAVSHTFALGGSDLGPREGGVQGMETRMRLAGSLGERARIRLDGVREDLEGLLPREDGTLPSNRQRSAVRVGLDYQATPEADLSFRAFFSRHDFSSLPPAVPQVNDGIREAETSWGYDAVWSQQLDPISRLDVRMEYRDTSMDLPGHVASGPDASALSRLPVSQRSLGAGGVYESLPAERHQVRVAFRARFLDLPLPGARSSPGPAGVTLPGEAGWNVGIRAEDSWSVAGPLTLVYGLGYRHVISDRDWILVAPRVGGVWSSGAVSVRGTLSYHAVDSWGEPLAAAAAGAAWERHLDEFGYETEVEASLPLDLRFRASASYAPVQFDPVGYEPGSLATTESPVFLSDGNASASQVSAAILRERPRTTLYLQWSEGNVNGMVASVRPFETPVLFLAPRTMEYVAGRFGFRSPPSGTDLVLEYRRERTGLLASAPEFTDRQEQIELRMLQELVRLRGGSAWHFLLALQRTALGSERAAESAALTASWNETITHHRVNAGVAVLF